ncbi:MAG: hypothetical protein IPG50_26625 [Myxococcales bacterium]|nr:hypothetical protein [Myxococcales bacterium]
MRGGVSYSLAVVFTSAALYACSSSESAPATPAEGADAAVAEDAGVEEASTTGPVDVACVPQVHTNRKVCDDCLLKKCCIVINTCFDDPICSALSDCSNDCQKLGTKTDAGVECIRKCSMDHIKGAQRYADMLDCQQGSCGTPCKA